MIKYKTEEEIAIMREGGKIHAQILKDLSKKILKVFSIFEHREENQIINNMITAMDVKEEARKALITQGLIELFRNWCSKNKCLECEIGKIVFN